MQYDTLYPALATMAMGDCQAVELGQMVHVKLSLLCGAMSPSEMLCVHGRAPRGPLACGVVIDDAVFLEAVPAHLCERELQNSEGVRRLKILKEEYAQRDLVHHPKKTFEAELFAEFWGSEVDGKKGHVRASAKRLIPLMEITATMARLGYSTVGLLQTVAGSWVLAYCSFESG